MNEIRKEDGIKAINSFDDQSIDLLLTDVPYTASDGQEHIIMTKALNRKKAYPLRTAFGTWDREQDYNTWLKQAIPKVKGWIIIWCGYRQFSDFYNILKANNFVKCGMYIWEKPLGFTTQPKHGFLPYLDMAVVGKRQGAWFVGSGIPNIGRYNLPRGTCDPTKDKFHPTQKPLTLFEDLILYTTQKNNLVVDCFAGSGTTNIACHYLDRNCISFETNDEFYDKASKRLVKHQSYSKKDELKKIKARLAASIAAKKGVNYQEICRRVGFPVINLEEFN